MIISVCNEKGGSGKTTIALNIAVKLGLHTPESFGQPADLHPDTLPELIRTSSRFIFGQF